MNTTHDRAANRFLSRLDRELGALPTAQRNDIIEDVEAHIHDSLDAGRDIDEILASLGAPRDAAKAYSDELGVPSSADPAQRASRWLAVAILAVGILVPTVMLIDQPGPWHEMRRSAALLLFAAPIILGALSLLAPRPWRTIGVAIAALGATAIVAAAMYGYSNFVMFTPVAMMLWVGVCAPLVASKGAHTLRVAWRVAGGIAVASPGIALAAGIITGTVMAAPVTVIVGVAILALGAFFGLGYRSVYVIVIVAGIAALISSLFETELLVAAIWSVGGLWIALGVGALAASRHLVRR